uniref:Leucine-rich repeat, cysteine-containing subtype n=1 Tax=Tanacetum cinerariifolium TaxID=118510 RepID=A0A699I6B6_TANCI|nr:leucine-rich repeat, cysteine-containing subtype [Tanacetum cinerariifolium]
MALNSTVLERLHVTNRHFYNAEYLTLLAKNCCNSLISLKIGPCYLSKLGGAFRYAVKLQHFGGYIFDKESELVGFQFPPNTRSLSMKGVLVTKHTTVLPFLNQIRKLKSLCISLWHGGFTDVGLEYIRKYGANLRSLTLAGTGKSNAGLVKLSEGCPRLRKLKLWGCPFSKQVVASSVFNIQSLRTINRGKSRTFDSMMKVSKRWSKPCNLGRVHCECGTRGCIGKTGD